MTLSLQATSDSKDSDDEPLVSKISKAALPNSKPEGPESDDDEPLINTINSKRDDKKLGEAKTPSSKKSKKSLEGASSAAKPKVKPAAKSPTTKSPGVKKDKNVTVKQEIIGQILARWWYIDDLKWPPIDWPAAADTLEDRPPPDFKPMPQFPYIFKRDSGEIRNLRIDRPDREPPCYKKLDRLDIKPLKQLLQKGYAAQVQVPFSSIFNHNRKSSSISAGVGGV